MNTHDAILFNIDVCGDPAVGRTALQKLIYFQTKCGIEIDVEYIPHYYGPYSKKIAVALAELVAFDYVDEKRSAVYGYAYGLTHDGREITDEAKEENRVAFESIERIINKIKDCLKPGPLSYAAKVHYIKEIYPESAPKDVAGVFGWQMSDSEIRTGQAILKRLKLDKDE